MTTFSMASELHKRGIISNADMEKHIENALSGEDKDARQAAMAHLSYTSDHANKVLGDVDAHTNTALTNRPNSTADHIRKVLATDDGADRAAAMNHKNVVPNSTIKSLV